MYSVIIPSIGRINFLNELLESIYNQTLLPDEIIIILDNNKLCRNKAKQIKIKYNCKIIYADNLNLAQKRNYGALISKSKFIIYSDDDDIWAINKSQKTIECLQNYKVVFHEFSKFGSYHQNPKFILGKKEKIIPIIFLILASNIFGGGSSIAAWREVFITIPFENDYSFCEDYDWWIKVFLAEIKVKYIPISLVKYRVHSNNMTTSFMKIYLYNFKIFNKLFIKSFILLATFVTGYLRTIIGIMLKLVKYFLNFISDKINNLIKR